MGTQPNKINSSPKSCLLLDEAMDNESENDDIPEDEEVGRLMEDHDIDEDTAEKVQELIEEGLDEDDAVELADEF